MRISKSVSADNKVVTIRVQGRFNIEVFDDFNGAYKDVSPPEEKYVVDLGETEHIDSAALGMLLLMRERLDRAGATVAVANCPREIKRVLETVGLQKLIHVE